MSSGDSSKKEAKAQTEGETFKGSISGAITKTCPPIYDFAKLFGSDETLWVGIAVAVHLTLYTTIPRSLLFLLPYPSVYLMPIYHTMKALQNAREPKMRAMWLSYWAVIGFVDTCELIILGSMAQTLTYWPLIKIIFAIFLMCETTDFTAEPKIDEALKKSLAKTVSAERRLKQAQGEEKGKIDAWRKLQNAKNEVEVAKTMFRPKRYHCFMLVEPFLPVTACAGGPSINHREPPPEAKIDPKTGRPEKTDEEKRDEDRLAEIKKWQFERERRAGGEGLGNWLQPVIDYGGQIVDHNPVTDSMGKILPQHQHGKSGEVKYGTPWDNDQQALDPKTGLPLGDAPRGKNTAREKDGKRIHLLPDVAWREYATNPGESTTMYDNDPWMGAQRDLGLGFKGWSGHETTEVAELDTVKMSLDPSVDWEMIKRSNGAYS